MALSGGPKDQLAYYALRTDSNCQAERRGARAGWACACMQECCHLAMGINNQQQQVAHACHSPR